TLRRFALLGLGHACGLGHGFGLRQPHLRNIGPHRFAAKAWMRGSRMVTVMRVMRAVVLGEGWIGGNYEDAGQHGSLLHGYCSPNATAAHDASNANRSQQKESVLPR